MIRNKHFLLLLIIYLPINLFACSFPPPAKINYFDFQFNDLIFKGKCLKIIRKGNENYAIFRIDRIFKGIYTNKTIELVASGNRGGDCRIDYQPNEEWINVLKITPLGYFGPRYGKSTTNKHILKDFETYSNISKIQNKFITITNGGTTIKGQIIDGVENGIWKYYKDKILDLKIEYKKGKIINIYKQNQKGKTVSVVKLINDKIIEYNDIYGEKIILKYPNDSIFISHYFKNGKAKNTQAVKLKNVIDYSSDYNSVYHTMRINKTYQMFFPKKFP